MTAATSASFPQTTGTTGSPISGYFIYLTLPYAQAFAVLHIGGADEGSRVRFLGSQTNQIPPLTPASTGSYTIRVYDSLTGGALLGETGTITVSAPQAPAIGSGVAPMLTLDASVASSVTSDSAYTTPQTTNNGAVLGWKDQTGNGYNFNQTTAGNGGVFLTGSQNGLPGIKFTPTGNNLLNGLAALATAAYNAAFTGSGFTMAIVFKLDALSGSISPVYMQKSGSSNFEFYLANGAFIQLRHYNAITSGSEQAFVSAPAANTLIKAVVRFDNVAKTITMSVNAIADGSSSFTTSDTNVFNMIQVGAADPQSGTTADVTLYEIDFWPTTATGAGGATPTGDIATIMQYLTAKWAS